jgi:hypothetical protein
MMWALGWSDEYAEVRETLSLEICNEFGRN